MKKFFRLFLLGSFITIIVFSLIFISDIFFGEQFFVFKDRFFSSDDGRMPSPDNISESEKVSFYELTEKGAFFSDSLMLVNPEHLLDENYSPALIDLNGNEVFINECAEEAYRSLKTAVAENCGDSLYIMSSYRTPNEQEEIKISEGEYAADVYSSEHLTGLAIDVYVMYHAGMGFLESSAGKFVNETCHEHGFIIRYPYYGEEITGIPYEPWHLRYVGIPHSEIIAENKLTLEEYIDSFIPGTFYFYDDYFISRQEKEEIRVPKGLYEISVSPDNTGYYIITGKYK